ncbi:MAG: right-handed parallel beta-helix repeat-containing protein [Phycisphaerales bacterium]|nr:right-handed parallel beta-helix repeat-containing protein [Phycisphaerales bacterium]
MKTGRWARLIGAACAAVLGRGALADTLVPPGPVIDTWTINGSPYIVQGDIQVIDLTIDPGVQVRVDGPFTIEVVGRISAIGSEGLPVLFTAHAAANPWRGLVFNDTPPGSVMEHCIVERSNNSGLRITSTSPQGAPPAVRRCTIRDNTSPLSGGGIRAHITAGEPLKLEHCTVAGNTANPNNAGGDYAGGGLYLTGSAVLLGSLFSDNKCYGSCPSLCNNSARGSALYCDGAGTLIATACEFKRGLVHSTVSFPGGAISRGAIYVKGPTVTLANSVVSCNTATGSVPSGSGVWVESGEVAIVNCTISGNSDEAVVCEGGSVAVRNSILFFNNGGGSQYSGPVDICYSDVQSELVPGCNNVSVGPGFSPSACGAFQICLPSVSGCIDAGDPDPQLNDGCLPPGRGTARNDMGAFGGPGNCAWTNPCYADCNWDCARNLSDFGCFQTKFATGDPYADCNGDGVRNLADFGCFQTKFALGCP